MQKILTILILISLTSAKDIKIMKNNIMVGGFLTLLDPFTGIEELSKFYGGKLVYERVISPTGIISFGGQFHAGKGGKTEGVSSPSDVETSPTDSTGEYITFYTTPTGYNIGMGLRFSLHLLKLSTKHYPGDIYSSLDIINVDFSTRESWKVLNSDSPYENWIHKYENISLWGMTPICFTVGAKWYPTDGLIGFWFEASTPLVDASETINQLGNISAGMVFNY